MDDKSNDVPVAQGSAAGVSGIRPVPPDTASSGSVALPSDTADGARRVGLDDTQGGDLSAQIDALHHQTFNSSPLSNHTELWNAVFHFKEKIKALLAPIADPLPVQNKEI